jgi:RND family efflux transporter MFP subunit
MKTFIQRHAGAFQLVFVIGVVGCAILISASLDADNSATRPRAAMSSVPVSVVTPAPDVYKPRVELSGVVTSRTRTSIVPQVSGSVVRVSPSFRPGARVSAGELLFVIDPADYKLAVDRTLAEIEVARSDLARLEAEAAAEREVWESSFPDRQIPDLIARKPQIAAARARILGGEAARAAAELALSRTEVRAPFDARILDTQLDVGQVVSGNAAVGSMFSEASLEISAPASAEELQRIGTVLGRKASIVTPGGTTVAGTIVRKAASLDERTRLGTLFIESDDPAALTLGEFVRVEVEGAVTDEAYRLPAAALTSRDRLWVVENEELVERQVELLGREGDTLVVSLFDTADGVVAIPPADVRAGLPVEPVSAEWTAGGGVASAAK